MEFTTLIYEGEIFRVEAYRSQSHGILSLEWLEKQPERYQIKFAALFERLANHGKIYNERKFKHLEASNQIFEFKVDNGRILSFFFFGKRIILTHGFTKKGRKTPRSEIERAEKIKMEFEWRTRHERN